MPEDGPSLHIDTDWKKQAQEEKRRLAEQEKQRATTAPPPGAVPPPGAAPADTADRDARAAREMPPPSFATLVSTMMTQALFYLGGIAPRGGEPVVNLDMAKHQIDLLGILEAKTKGNLTADEQKLLDSALYDLRMRYVSVASQYIT